MLTENRSFVLKYGSITSAIVNSPFELGHTGLLHKAKKAGFFHFFGNLKKTFFPQKSRFFPSRIITTCPIRLQNRKQPKKYDSAVLN